MLITIRFSKMQNGTFVAHTDILRALNRTFRRAGIQINYSNGFNKHMLLNMTQPLPLGIASEGEYVTADVASEMDPETFLAEFNRCCPPFLHAMKAYKTEKKPALASVAVASRFFFRTPLAYAVKEKIEACKGNYTFTYTHGGKEKTVNAGEMIYELSVTESGINALIASGNVNLRSDALARSLNEDFGLGIELSDIVRLEQYVLADGKLIPAAKYMENLE